jgi:hyperosmotically inducible periplasmic protein
MRLVLCGLTVLAMVLAPAAARAGVGEMTKDSWLTTKTKMALVTDKRVAARHINVETQAGVITLRGKVRSAEERTAAEEIARGVGGATSVSSALQVVPEEQRASVDAKDAGIEKAVKARLDTDEHLKSAGIKVRSDNSVVTLMGAVSDHKARTRASDVVRGVPGVKAIRNELAQKG